MISTYKIIMFACVLVLVAGCKESREKSLAVQAEQDAIARSQACNTKNCIQSSSYADFAQPIIRTDIQEQYAYGSNVIINLVWTGNPRLVVHTNLLSVSYRLKAGNEVLANGKFALQDGLVIEHPGFVPLGKVECGVLAPGEYCLEVIIVARWGIRDRNSGHWKIVGDFAFAVAKKAESVSELP